MALGWDDPDLAVGKLLKVWRWFDQHSVDGNAPSVTAALLDRLVGVTGLAQAMVDVGWLEVNGTGLKLPNFHIHNGKTAKDRLLTAKRVANHKSNAEANAQTNGASVSCALPREEKNREESLSPLPPSGADVSMSAVAVKRKKREAGSRIPENWGIDDTTATGLSDEVVAAARELKDELGVDWQVKRLTLELGDFRDYWLALPGAKACKLDWLATWRVRLRQRMAAVPGNDPVRRDRLAAARRDEGLRP